MIRIGTLTVLAGLLLEIDFFEQWIGQYIKNWSHVIFIQFICGRIKIGSGHDQSGAMAIWARKPVG